MGLFGFLRRSHHVPLVPDGSRIYAIGDVHGRADLLAALHDQIRTDGEAHPDHRKVLIYIGDYVDRGMESREVIDLVLDHEPPGFEVVPLKGNHEALMLDFFEDAGNDEIWIGNGGKATLYSYGIMFDGGLTIEDGYDRVRHRFREALPERHLKFLKSLRNTHIEGDYLFVHAGICPGLPLAEQEESELLWIRDEFLASSADHGKVVVHGHSISRSWEPEVMKNRIGIDTGAFVSGVLTCVVLQGAEQSFLRTGQ